MRDFSDYMDASNKIANTLFGEELMEKMKDVELKAFEWDGADIEENSILVVTAGVKERFNERWTEYFKDNNYTAWDIFLQTVFHYGYQQGCDSKKERIEDLQETLEIMKSLR